METAAFSAFLSQLWDLNKELCSQKFSGLQKPNILVLMSECVNVLEDSACVFFAFNQKFHMSSPPLKGVLKSDALRPAAQELTKPQRFLKTFSNQFFFFKVQGSVRFQSYWIPAWHISV